MSNQNYQLVVRRGPQEGHVFPLTGDMMTIGRDPMSDITLNDPEISRQHARLARTGDSGYEIQDLGSTNGTFVDGNRLGGERVTLSPGQVLVLGSNVSLVLETVPGQMATVVASRSDFDLDQVDEPEPMAPPMEEPEPMAPPMDEPEPEAAIGAAAAAAVFAQLEPEPVDAEPAEEVSEMMATDKLEADMAPAPEEPEPVAPELEPAAPAMDHDATIIDYSFEKPSYPVFEAQEPAEPSFAAPEPLPPYEDEAAKTMLDSSADIPSAPPPSSQPVFQAQQPAGPSTPPPFQTSPPPPPPPAAVVSEPAGDGGNNNRNRNIIIAVVVIILLCCCCSLIAASWVYGDAILNGLNLGALPVDLLGALFA